MRIGRDNQIIGYFCPPPPPTPGNENWKRQPNHWVLLPPPPPTHSLLCLVGPKVSPSASPSPNAKPKPKPKPKPTTRNAQSTPADFGHSRAEIPIADECGSAPGLPLFGSAGQEFQCGVLLAQIRLHPTLYPIKQCYMHNGLYRVPALCPSTPQSPQ